MTMTPCDRLTALLADAPEAGKALATLEAGLAAHATDCARCGRALADAARLVDGLGALHADYEPPADLAATAMRRAAAPVKATAAVGSPSKVRGYALAGLFGAAAATAAVLALGPGGVDRGPPIDPKVEPRPRDLGPAHANTAKVEAGGLSVAACLGDGGETSCDVGLDLVTAVGETRAFRLSDGTTLQVDQDSHLVFDGARRALKILRGDAFLDVAHRDDLDKLVVTLPTGAVEVLGTELEVRAGQSLSVVDVVRGMVSVATAPGADGDTSADDGEARVKAGQTAWLRAGKKPLVKTSSSAAGPTRDFRKHDDGAYANLGFGSIRARRPGASNDTDRPLRLVDHQVDVRIQGDFAKTTIEESFASDEAAELEGIYRFTLPPGAQVAELSLMVDGRWEEGAFVERDRAEKIWAGVIRNAMPVYKRREIIEYIWVPGPWRDPALLSQRQGNTFELRIFPIPARGERRVRIAYTESLPLVTGARRYVLPLPSSGANASAERFSLDLRAGTTVAADDLRVRNYELARTTEAGLVRLATEQRSFRPKGDLIVDVPDLAAAEDLVALAWGKGGDAGRDGYVALTLRPELAGGDSGERAPIDVVVIADTSYGIQKVRLQREAELVRELVAGLGEDDRVQVLACATTCRSFGALDQASDALGRDLAARLASVEPLGATRLGAAFEAARRALDGSAPERRRIVYLGDGVPSVGELDPARVVESIRGLIGDTRVTTVALGGETERAVLAGLGEGHASSFVDYALMGSVEATAARVIARQHGTPLTDIELVLPEGLSEVAPARLAELWPGDERVITARTALGRIEGDVVLRGTLAGEAVERRWGLELAVEEAAGNAFVPRLWAERRIAELSAKDDLGTKAEIVRISQAHHVLSRHTSLLVLESPAMARAFDVHAKEVVADWSGDLAAATKTGTLLANEGGLAGPTDPNEPTDPTGHEQLTRASADAPDKEAKAYKAAEVADNELQDGDGFNQLRGKSEDLGGGRSGVGDLAKGDWAPDPAPLQPPKTVPMRPADEWRERDRGGRWVAMKKVWFKEATIGEHRNHDDAAAERELSAREDKLDQEPESRERTMALVRWHLRMNAPDAAEKLALRWIEKDRMDPDALIALADVAALRGDLERSKALLSSAVEADPHRAATQLRLAQLYEATGEATLSCEHRLSRALVARSDVTAQVEAIRCGGREARIVAGLEEGVQVKVERALDKDARTAKVSGPFRIAATWGEDGERDGAGVDLDVIVVSPQGQVVSWLGGAELSVEDADAEGRESLSFKGRDNGRWTVLVARKDGDDRARAEGTLRITAHGTTRRVPFVIDGDEAVVPVADIDVAARFRMEPVAP